MSFFSSVSFQAQKGEKKSLIWRCACIGIMGLLVSSCVIRENSSITAPTANWSLGGAYAYEATFADASQPVLRGVLTLIDAPNDSLIGILRLKNACQSSTKIPIDCILTLRGSQQKSTGLITWTDGQMLHVGNRQGEERIGGVWTLPQDSMRVSTLRGTYQAVFVR